MKKLREAFGRGYLLGFTAVACTFVLTVIALRLHPDQYQFVMSFWTEFLKWFVVPLVGAKELGKIGTAFAGRLNVNKKEPKPEGD